MPTTVIIPARYESSRFPGKPLTPLRGATGEYKTLIRRTWEVAVQFTSAENVYVASDDDRVISHARQFGQAIKTVVPCENGTERCAVAANILALNADDLVINLQGDSPLMPWKWLDRLARFMLSNPETEVATVAAAMPDEPKPGAVSVVPGLTADALYFSRSRIPSAGPWFMHFGIYAYRVSTLRRYLDWGPSPYERAEALEQIRFLERGVPMHCYLSYGMETAPLAEVNYPNDVLLVERELERCNIK